MITSEQEFRRKKFGGEDVMRTGGSRSSFHLFLSCSMVELTSFCILVLVSIFYIERADALNFFLPIAVFDSHVFPDARRKRCARN